MFLVSGGGVTYSFVDDKEKESSLATMSCAIKEGINKGEAKLLLSSPRYCDVLLGNLRDCEIFECYDGLVWISKMLNAYFTKFYSNTKRLIAILLNGYELTQKHLGDIPERLEKNGFKIVYVITFSSRWVNELEKQLKEQNKDYIFAEYEFLEHLNFFPFLIEQADVIKVHPDVKSLKIFTSMEQMPHRIWLPKEFNAAQDFSMAMSSYVNVHFQSIYPVVVKAQQFDNIYPDAYLRLVKGGYPSIDKQSQLELDFSVKRDTVIFVVDLVEEYHLNRYAKIMRNLLDNGFRVLFKKCPPHIELDALENAFAEQFIEYENFINYAIPRLTQEENQRAIALVGYSSSMCYSFPTVNKRPAIVLYPSRGSLLGNENDVFFHPSLHIQCFEEEDSELLETIKTLANDGRTQKQWQERIEDFCREDCYHYGNASVFLTDWIIDWYDKRDILIKE